MIKQSNEKSHYEIITSLSVREMAAFILEHEITDTYCRRDCVHLQKGNEDNIQLDECLNCCIRWLSEAPEVAECRICGCTQYRACPDGCSWVEPDLCSRCADDFGL